jgi:hypothetical protein
LTSALESAALVEARLEARDDMPNATAPRLADGDMGTQRPPGLSGRINAFAAAVIEHGDGERVPLFGLLPAVATSMILGLFEREPYATSP